jgi:hypothetical protein
MALLVGVGFIALGVAAPFVSRHPQSPDMTRGVHTGCHFGRMSRSRLDGGGARQDAELRAPTPVQGVAAVERVVAGLDDEFNAHQDGIVP